MPLGQGIAGALGGFASGGPWGAALGGITGLLGLGGRHEDPVMKQQRAFQNQIAQRLYGFGTSVPGSDPSELAALSEQRGQLGAEQRANQQRVMGAWNANQGLPAATSLSNLGSQSIAQQMALHSNLMQRAMAARRQ